MVRGSVSPTAVDPKWQRDECLLHVLSLAVAPTLLLYSRCTTAASMNACAGQCRNAALLVKCIFYQEGKSANAFVQNERVEPQDVRLNINRGCELEGPRAISPELLAVRLVILARELRVGPSNIVKADLQAHRRFCNTPCCCYCCYSPCKWMRADITLGSPVHMAHNVQPERMADPRTDRTASSPFTWLTWNHMAP